jgi:hypothetical protein
MFKIADESMGLAPVSHIKATLDRIFGGGQWVTWELETVSMELGLVLDELTRDKICLLQAIEVNPKLFFEDISFFLHATDTINNRVADFDSLPMPNTLELAYAIEESKQLNVPREALSDPKSDIVQAITYLLKEEGYSEPVYPFTFVPNTTLFPGQTPGDTEAKKKAIEVYISEMGGL